MTTQLLSLLLLLAVPALPEAGGTVSGQIQLTARGAPRPDASGTVVWIEGARRPGDVPGAVRRQMKSDHKKFVPRVVVVPRSTPVEFPNVDAIYHNVFSVSGANRFDLGLYRSGASKAKEFDQPGLVRVYCNIHPQMVGFVMVVDSDFAAVAGPDGRFRFDGVPAGSWTVKAWHEEAASEAAAPVAVRPGADATVSLSLDVSAYRPEPHKNKYGKDYPPQPASEDERY
jgi:plastocyanin